MMIFLVDFSMSFAPKQHLRFVFALIAMGLSLHVVAEKQDASPTIRPEISLNLTSGIFVTTAENIIDLGSNDTYKVRGVVVPWKVETELKHKLYEHTQLAISLATESGIDTTQAPYIDGFSNSPPFPKPITLNKATVNQTISPTSSLAVGVGRVKANILKKGKSLSPLPFSGATHKPPMKSIDFAVGVQKSDLLFANHTVSAGFAANEIASKTVSRNRLNSFFLESHHSFENSNLWAQYTKNSLSGTYDSDHYVHTGFDMTSGASITSLSTAFNRRSGLVGFDCGYAYKLANINGVEPTMGIGYAASQQKSLQTDPSDPTKTVEKKGLEKTLEASLALLAPKGLKVTIACYYKKPFITDQQDPQPISKEGYFSGGLRLEQNIHV